MPKKEKPTTAVKPKPKKKKPRKKGVFKHFQFTGDDGVEYSLTKQQKLFVEHYLINNTNGTEAVIAAGYKVKNSRGFVDRKLASAISTENLSKPVICAYITVKLDEYGFNDDNIEKQHLFLVNQNSNLPTKQRAIDSFYKLKGKFAPEEKTVKHELTEELLDRIIKG